MDPVLALLEVVGVGLPAVLALTAFLAAQRYSESRFWFVGAGVLAFAAVSLLGLIDNLSPGALAGADLGYPTVLLLLVGEVLLYLFNITGRKNSGRQADG